MKHLFFRLKIIAILLLSIALLTNCKKEEASDVNVTSVFVSPVSLKLAVGETLTLEAEILPKNATNQAVTYESSNPYVVSAISNGLVTGISEGEATVIVRTEDGGKTASCTVTVVPAISRVRFVKRSGNYWGNPTRASISTRISFSTPQILQCFFSNGDTSEYYDIPAGRHIPEYYNGNFCVIIKDYPNTYNFQANTKYSVICDGANDSYYVMKDVTF
jgi:hypothetical protein